MHKITFFPLNNADTTLIRLENGKNILIDFADKKKDDDTDKRCDLPQEINARVSEDYFDAVCFTHLDDDHYCGSSGYFYLQHAKKYQGEGRKKMNEMWVPAASIIEDKLEDEARVLQAEARYRFKQGKDILVFSKPDKLKEWCKNNDLDFNQRKHLIVDAGTLVPSFSLDSDGIELFVHSPFVGHINECDVINRNDTAITMQATFNDTNSSKLILGADIGWEIWDEIVAITKFHNNEDRLKWDIFNISHHCSYKSLAEEKGDRKTEPSENIKWLFEVQGNSKGYIVSPSKPIPSTYDDVQPPHKQAANYYQTDGLPFMGKFLVTMNHPNSSNPKPMEFEIKQFSGVTLLLTSSFTGGYSSDRTPPRAG